MDALFAKADSLASLLSEITSRLAIELDQFGNRFETLASVKTDTTLLSIASDVGGKERNEDAILFALPHQPSSLRWLGAVADGVSSSIFSDLGSRLACHAGLVAIKRSYERELPTQKPIRQSLKLFRDIGANIDLDPERFCPEGTTQNTWNRSLCDGRTFQSTLTLIWEDEQGLKIEGIGDGGFLLALTDEFYDCHYLPSSDKPVNCLGPRSKQVDRDFRFEFSEWSQISVFTDGLTETIPDSPERDHGIPAADGTSPPNPASEVIKRILESEPEQIEDNVSLLSAIRGAS